MNKTLDDLYNLIVNGNKEIKQEIQDLRHHLVSEIEDLKFKNKALEENNKLLHNKLIALERKSKKYNFVVYGIQGDELQTTNEVLNIINQELLVNCDRNNFRDIFRIGQHSRGKCRPVIIETIDYDLKQKILINAKKKFKELQQNGIFFAQDLAQEDYKIKKVLSKHLKEAKTKKYNAYIKNDVLIVNGEEFTYNYLQNNNIPDVDNLRQDEPTQQRTYNVTDKAIPEQSISKSNNNHKSPIDEKTSSVDENQRRKFENTYAKGCPIKKIQTRSHK